LKVTAPFTHCCGFATILDERVGIFQFFWCHFVYEIPLYSESEPKIEKNHQVKNNGRQKFENVEKFTLFAVKMDLKNNFFVYKSRFNLQKNLLILFLKNEIDIYNLELSWQNQRKILF